LPSETPSDKPKRIASDPTQFEQDPLRAGDALFADGQFQAALGHHLAVLERRPAVAEYHYRVGLDYARLKGLDAAERHFREAARLKPDYAHAHGAIADVLLLSGRVEDALRHARLAVGLAPEDPELALGLASVLEADRQSESAREIVERLLGCGYESSRLAVLYGSIAGRMKREEEALDVIGRVLARVPPPPAHEQSALHFAAAGLLDGLKRYDEAFEHATRANALRGVRYDPAIVERLTRDFIDYFSADRMRQLPRATHGDQTPVFIVGMPRSGTTLIEQILASHPAIYGAGELGWVYRLWESAVRKYSVPTAPLLHCLDRIGPAEANELAAEYLNPLHTLAPTAERITDKTPPNVMHLGLIAILFPNAKVIHCRRDPLDTCLSCFMTNFAAGNNFSSDLMSAGHFYLQNERMMRHWKSVLELPILDVEYEQVVGDLEGHARRMLQFLGLPWNDQCLRFNENKRFVATASNSQVREPIYQKSVGRWRHYARHLQPLKSALEAERNKP
jgi:tetratricopeptide (TPR) repeat protein